MHSTQLNTPTEAHALQFQLAGKSIIVVEGGIPIWDPSYPITMHLITFNCIACPPQSASITQRRTKHFTRSVEDINCNGIIVSEDINTFTLVFDSNVENEPVSVIFTRLDRFFHKEIHSYKNLYKNDFFYKGCKRISIFDIKIENRSSDVIVPTIISTSWQLLQALNSWGSEKPQNRKHS